MLNFLVSPYGRISRKAYWLNFLLPYIAISIVVTILDFALFEVDPVTEEPPPIFQGVATLVLLWPSLAVTTKRLHDRGMTGWWQAAQFVLIVLIAAASYWYYSAKLAGAMPTEIVDADQRPNALVDIGIVLVVAVSAWVFLYPLVNALFLRGQTGSNKYGDDPLGHPVDTFT